MSVAQITEVRMPRLSDSMEEGTIVRWLKAAGEVVAAGESLVEIETDKATMEYEAEAAGTLEILAAEGATVALGEAIARLLPDGSAPGEERPARVLATPVARRMASELGVDLSTVTATGRRGQIMKADVEASADGNGDGNGAAPARESACESQPEPSAAEPEREQLTRTQRTIARRMAQSRAVVPDIELVVDIDMGACLALRAQLAEHHSPAPSVNDLVIKACALALRAHPRVNGSYADEAFVLHEHVNVGFAVAAPDSLLVPVVTDADRRPVTEIAAVTRELAVRARDGAVTPADVSGATFTVSNLGMFGVDRFTAIINTPQAAILAAGAAVERPVVRDRVITTAVMMTATLAADHRILYGADAARFLTDVRDRLQAPIGLLA
ncbi:MAG TPA: dihydrolipoamide acetyltransferase family protein [Solirubrobacteraceae bacterium]|nr:dihydrolipoamide acetyltransferase family protein [Solirubrobacteraceae bacterium]